MNLGEKHVCGVCTARFYDLNKRLVFCPKCGQEVTERDIVRDFSPLESGGLVEEVSLFLEESFEEGSGDFEEAFDFADAPLTGPLEKETPESPELGAPQG